MKNPAKCFLAFGISMIAVSAACNASARELATLPGATISVESEDFCAGNVPVIIKAKSVEFFDTEADNLLNSINAARVSLEFGCQSKGKKIGTLSFSGVVDGEQVFSGQGGVEKYPDGSQEWVIVTDPAPLEGIALVLKAMHEPGFFHLDTIHRYFAIYGDVTGIEDTYQYSLLEEQAREMMTVVDGDVTNFEDYLKQPQGRFLRFKDLDQHFKNVLTMIERFAPDHHKAYAAAYESKIASVRDEFWNNRIAALTTDKDNVESVVKNAVELSQAQDDTEFTNTLDTNLVEWISDQTGAVTENLSYASIDTLNDATIFAMSFPENIDDIPLPKSKAELNSGFSALTASIADAEAQLLALSKEEIAAAGERYFDVENIFAVSFALAEEFDAVNYPNLAQDVLLAGFNRIDEVLKNDLSSYQKEISGQKLDAELLLTLREQAGVFETLSEEFPAFAKYQDVAEAALEGRKAQTCEGLLKDADVHDWDLKKRLYVGGEQVLLSKLACDLNEFDSTITSFKWVFRPGLFKLGIADEDGEERLFSLKADKTFSGQDLRVTADLSDNPKGKGQPISADEWKAYIDKLLLPPPTGIPDQNGIRECDTLAADPHDPQKLTDGVDFEAEDLDLELFERGIDACIAAVEHDPTDIRQNYQLGRILYFAGDAETAPTYFEEAYRANYAPALFYKAEFLLANSEDPDSFIDALDLFEKSGKLGYQPGADMVKELNPEGIEFFKDIPQPSKKQLLAAIGTSSNIGTPAFFGVSMRVYLKDISIKSCVQTSATDFNCEYTETRGCSVSGATWAHNMLMSSMCDAAGAEIAFADFRKLSSGNWKLIKKY